MFGLFKSVLFKVVVHQWIWISLISSMTIHHKLDNCTDIRTWKKTFSSWDAFVILNHSQKYSIDCSKWSPQPITIEVYDNKHASKLIVNGHNSEFPFHLIASILSEIMPVRLQLNSIEVSNFCIDPSTTTNHLDLAKLITRQKLNLEILKMSNNCLQSITGNIKAFRYLTELDLSFNQLTQIPRDLNGLRQLVGIDPRNNFFSETNFLFKISSPQLNKIKLSHNNFSSLPQDALKDFILLKELDLSHNDISFLFRDFLVENSDLQVFDISYNKLTTFDSNILRNSIQLVEINLSYNKIKNLTIVGQELPNLKVLRLESNNINYFDLDLWFSKSLNEILISNNSISEINKVDVYVYTRINYDLSNNKLITLKLPLTSYIQTGDTLDMSNNCIHSYEVTDDESSRYIENYKCSNCCLDSIRNGMFDRITKKVDISINNITKLDKSILEAFQNIPTIILSNNQIAHLNLSDFENYYKDTGKKVYFDLSHNPFVCDCRLIKFIEYLKHNQTKTFTFNIKNNFCVNPTKLNGTSLLTLKSNNLFCDYPEDCPAHCYCSIDDIDNISLVLIDCINSNLTHFPNINSYGASVAIQLNLSNNQISTFPGKYDPIWSKVTILDLSHNQIKSLKNMTVSSNLTTLYLQNNSLSEFDDKIMSLTYLDHMTLANNPWKCNCEMSKFVGKMKLSVLDDKYEMLCVKDEMWYNITDVDHICTRLTVKSGFNWLFLFLPISITVIIIFIIIILFIKYKSEIVYYMFSKGICLRFVCEEDIDADKVYDAFISYSSEDEDWIVEFLVPGLESSTPPYNLCLHNRDWIGGEFISDQIIRSVESSRRTIIVLTDNFLKSAWGRLEFDVAYQQGLKDKVHRVLVVVPNEVPDMSQIDHEFKTFITLTTYIEANKPYFWRKIRATMPRTKQPRTRKPVYLNTDVSVSEL